MSDTNIDPASGQFISDVTILLMGAEFAREARALATLRSKNRQLTSEIRRLRKESTRDHLTGLLNRRGFDQNSSIVYGDRKRAKQAIAVIYFDLNGFKPINDTLGHAAGDQILQRTAKAMRKALHRSTDILARIGGDEFAIAAPADSIEEVIEMTTRLQNAINLVHIVGADHKNHGITAAIGCMLIPVNEEYIDLDTALQHLDNGMYISKRDTLHRICIVNFQGQDPIYTLHTPNDVAIIRGNTENILNAQLTALKI